MNNQEQKERRGMKERPALVFRMRSKYKIRSSALCSVQPWGNSQRSWASVKWEDNPEPPAVSSNFGHSVLLHHPCWHALITRATWGFRAQPKTPFHPSCEPRAQLWKTLLYCGRLSGRNKAPCVATPNHVYVCYTYSKYSRWVLGLNLYVLCYQLLLIT